MKYTFYALLLFFSSANTSITFGQTARSEFIRFVSHNQINGDKLEQTDSVVLQINERMGDHDAEIFIPYSKGDKVSIGNAWIEDIHGNIVRKLNSKEIKDRSSISDISLYEDDYVKSFELKHNIYPYRIVYSYKVTYSKFLSAVAFNYRNSKKTIKNGTIIANIPFGRIIKYKQENTSEPEIDTLSNSIQYKWKYSYNPPKTTERNASLNTADAPAIHVVPPEFQVWRIRKLRHMENIRQLDCPPKQRKRRFDGRRTVQNRHHAKRSRQ